MTAGFGTLLNINRLVRIRIPIKGVTINHVQSFDYGIYCGWLRNPAPVGNYWDSYESLYIVGL